MKLCFLGNSGGIQGLEGSNTSYAILWSNHLALVDCSGSPVEALCKSSLNVEALDLVFLTHAHIDHLYALPSLIHNLFLQKRQRPLEIIGNAETIEVAKRLTEVFNLKQKKGIFDFFFTTLDEGRLEREGLEIQSFKVCHGISTNGYCFTYEGRKITSFADCNASTVIPDFTYNSDVLIHEASLEGKPDHSSAEQAGLCAFRMGAKMLYLVHLPQDLASRNTILKQAREAFNNVQIASLSKQINI